MRSGQSLARVILGLVGLLALGAASASAQFYDARRMGMGGAAMPGGGGQLSRVNPAYRAVPVIELRNSGTSIPLPLGLIQAINDFPETDPESDDFSLVEILNYSMNIPYAYEIRRSQPPSGDIEFTVDQNSLKIDLGEMQEYVPDEPFTLGGFGQILDLGWGINLGQKGGLMRVDLFQGFLHNEFAFDLGEDLRRVLTNAEPIVGGQDYDLIADGILQAGFSSGLTYARQIPLVGPGVNDSAEDWAEDYWSSEADQPRMWVGIGVHRVFGAGLGKFDSDLTLRGSDPLFASSNPDSFDIDYVANVLTAVPEDAGDLAQATSVDLGMVYRYRRVEVGAGVANMFADLEWNNVDLQQYSWDERSGDFSDTTLAEGITRTTTLPVSWIVNANFYHDNMVFAADVSGGPGGESFHAGTEAWVTPVSALRGGISIDERGKFQFGWGAGTRLGSFGLDLGFATHSRSLSGKRDISVGLGLVLY